MIDPDVQANLIARLGAAGLSLFPYEEVALSRFARRAKANGYWDKIYEFIPFCGRNKEASVYKLKWAPQNTNILSPIAGDYFDIQYSPRAGYNTRNGISMNTGFTASRDLTSNASFLMGLAMTQGSRIQGFHMGVVDDPNARAALFIDTAQLITPDPLIVGGGASLAATTGAGFYVANRTSNVASTFYKNGVQIGAYANNNAASGLPTRPIYIGGFNNNGGNVSHSPYDNIRLGVMGVGFTAANAISLSTDVALLMQDLRRV